MIRTLFIDQRVADHPVTRTFCSRVDAPVKIVASHHDVYSVIRTALNPIDAGKQNIYLTANRGAFIKPCPGTRFYLCCGYTILHHASFCLLDCSYCILQTYFHPPVLSYFVNHEDLYCELTALFEQKRVQRIGTGEFTDSLIWERFSDLTPQLVGLFGNQTHCVLELKTKTTQIDALKHLKHNQKTILAWSLNTPAVIASEERRTTSLNERIEAAESCRKWGYPLAFHFDPMILYPGCEQEYIEVFRRLFSRISPDNIVYISLGTFRFMPDLKKAIETRFVKSRIVYGEFIPGMDGKMRYFKPLRLEFYRTIITAVRKMAPDVLLYFCMEDETVWQQAMGFSPREKGGLSSMLNNSAIAHCRLSVPQTL